jgi:ATP-dependent Clp protease adaptor protein ClpS
MHRSFHGGQIAIALPCHDRQVSSTLSPTIAPERESTEQVFGDTSAAPDRPWITIVWNDPINLMSYVTHVFMTVFGYPKSKAEKLMLDVHQRGKAIVSSGTREKMELDVNTLHGYGLWATLEQQS